MSDPNINEITLDELIRKLKAAEYDRGYNDGYCDGRYDAEKEEKKNV